MAATDAILPTMGTIVAASVFYGALLSDRVHGAADEARARADSLDDRLLDLRAAPDDGNAADRLLHEQYERLREATSTELSSFVIATNVVMGLAVAALAAVGFTYQPHQNAVALISTLVAEATILLVGYWDNRLVTLEISLDS